MTPAQGASRMQARAGLLASLMALLFVAVLIRLVDLQVLQRPMLVAKAERQQFARVEVPGLRGRITDRDGQVLAESVGTESVFVSAGLVKARDRARVARALAVALGLNEREMRRRLERGKPFWAARDARLGRTAKLREYKINAFSYQAETKRIYPQGRLASHVLGFTNVDGRGLEGVERSYQKVLGGTPGVKDVLRDAAGRQIPNQDQWVDRPKDGADLRLTLDAQLQHIAERELAKAYHKFNAKGAALVLMDPRSGEILALASMPDYAPADPTASSMDARRDRVVSDAYEPGSTFKAVTASLALEHGVVKPDSPIDCHQGRLEIFKRVVRDHGTDHLGVVPFSTVIAQSSNVGTVEVGMRLGAPQLYAGMTRFGFGSPTGIDLPGETVGTLRPLADWTPGSIAAVPFGQEFSCNLLRILVTYAAIANGGRLVRPHVVKEMVSAGGSTINPERNRSKVQVMSEAVRQQLVPMLKGVVEEGTGDAVALPGYSIAGKTGTAQKFNLKTGRYSQTANVATFVGFVPADQPAFVAAVMLDEPHGITLGGWTAGPVFRSVVSAALTAYGIAPSEAQRDRQWAAADKARHSGDPSRSWSAVYRQGAKAAEVKPVEVPDVKTMTLTYAKIVLTKAGLRVHASGQGRVSAQFPKAGADVLENSTVQLVLEDAEKAAADSVAKPRSQPGILARLFQAH